MSSQGDFVQMCRHKMLRVYFSHILSDFLMYLLQPFFLFFIQLSISLLVSSHRFLPSSSLLFHLSRSHSVFPSISSHYPISSLPPLRPAIDPFSSSPLLLPSFLLPPFQPERRCTCCLLNYTLVVGSHGDGCFPPPSPLPSPPLPAHPLSSLSFFLTFPPL